MINPITCSTGLLYKFLDDNDSKYFDKIFDILKNYDFDGFELAFQRSKRLKNFNLSKENLIFLKSLKFNTLHAPCDYVFTGNNKSKELLKKMESIYELINAKNIVFHTCCFQNNYDILKNYNFNYSIENEDNSKDYFNKIKDLNNFLIKNKNYKFTFDFAHAYTVYEDKIIEFIKALNDKIVQVHLAKIKINHHYFIHKSNIEDLMKKFKESISDKVIITSELCLESMDELKHLAKELEYLRKL
jgi:hypothetical protein